MRGSVPQYVLAFVLITATVGLLWAGSTSSAAFGGYNPNWEGSSEVRVLAAEDTDVRVVRDDGQYGDLGANATLVVLSPSTPYDDASTGQIREFVRNGGTLVVAGDFDPQVNEFLAGVGVDSRIDGRLLRDERRHGATPAMPVATTVENTSYTRTADRLALNHPSVVNASADARVVANSSPYSYLDTNRNDVLDDAETMQSSPVAVTEPVGDGSVVVVADPSLFINSMLEKRDNRAFASALVDDDRVVFDYSHAGGVPPLTALVLTLRESMLAQLSVAVALVVLATIGMTGRRPFAALERRYFGSESRDVTLGEDDVLEFVRTQYPDWDDDRVERLAQSINLRSRNDEGER